MSDYGAILKHLTKPRKPKIIEGWEAFTYEKTKVYNADKKLASDPFFLQKWAILYNGKQVSIKDTLKDVEAFFGRKL